MNTTGTTQQFETGSVRDADESKSRIDLISPMFLDRLGQWLRKGAEKYSERNWELGQPFARVMASCLRHLNAYREGKRDEDHLIAAACNLMFLAHYEAAIERGLLPASLDNLPRYNITRVEIPKVVDNE